MTNSPDLKQKAITLRKQGLSYSEIRRLIPVAKSTLSDWLHSVGLAKYQKQILTEKKQLAQKKGAATRKTQGVSKELLIKQEARTEAKKFIADPLWLVGVILYWGEGSKQKPWTTSVPVQFMNMDPEAHKLFLRWSKKYLQSEDHGLKYEIYIHPTGDTVRARKYWSEKLSVPLEKIRVYFKKNNLNPKRKNINQDYYGVLKASIFKSTDLNRKIAGWTEGVIQYLS